MQRLLQVIIIVVLSFCANSSKQIFRPKYDYSPEFFSLIEEIAEQSINKVELSRAFEKGFTTNIGQECLKNLIELLASRDGYQFFDAWGRIPSGLLYGHLLDLGNFDECLAASKQIQTSSASSTIKGKYVLMQAEITQNRTLENLKMGTLFESPDFVAFTFGTCFPNSCSDENVLHIFQTLFNTTTKLAALFDRKSNASEAFHSSISFSVRSSSVLEPKPFDSVAILALCVFGVIGALVLLSSLYEYYANRKLAHLAQPNLLLISFSVFTNGRKLFFINAGSYNNSNNIECLNGIRVLSMIWVIFGHTHIWGSYFPFSNTIEIRDWVQSPYSMLLQSATVSVDSFLLISGILLSWVALAKLEKDKGKLNIPLMYLHRYIRLTPVIAATILFAIGVVPFLGAGPFWNDFSNELTKNCRTNWWITLLYINNYLNPYNLCLGHTWYLAVDMQLFFISPIILLGLWRWRTKFIWALGLLACLSYGCSISSMIMREFNGILMGGLLSDDQTVWIYYSTHKRMAPWLIGIVFGYYLYEHRKSHLQLPTFLILLGWLLSLSTMLAVIFGPYHLAKNSIEPSYIEAALYEAFGRTAWVLGLAWIIFACHKGYSRTLNDILSYDGWQPIVRLTYVMYVISVMVQGINAGNIKTDKHFTTYEVIQTFWSELGISLCISVIVVLAMESPVIAIEKYFYARRNTVINQPSAPSAEV